MHTLYAKLEFRYVRPKLYLMINLCGLETHLLLCERAVKVRLSYKNCVDDNIYISVPDEPPLTDVGSFEIVAFDDGYREVYIYWKHIKEKQKNGPLFRYGISCEEDDSIKPTEITNAYAKFDNLPASKSYTFHIWSENMNGSSLGRSTVRVPKEADRTT